MTVRMILSSHPSFWSSPLQRSCLLLTGTWMPRLRSPSTEKSGRRLSGRFKRGSTPPPAGIRSLSPKKPMWRTSSLTARTWPCRARTPSTRQPSRARLLTVARRAQSSPSREQKTRVASFPGSPSVTAEPCTAVAFPGGRDHSEEQDRG
jgi:hypothetical protein